MFERRGLEPKMLDLLNCIYNSLLNLILKYATNEFKCTNLILKYATNKFKCTNLASIKMQYSILESKTLTVMIF